MTAEQDKEKNRVNWEKAIKERQRLVTEIRRRGIKTPIDPHKMKMSDLRKILSVN